MNILPKSYVKKALQEKTLEFFLLDTLKRSYKDLEMLILVAPSLLPIKTISQ